MKLRSAVALLLLLLVTTACSSGPSEDTEPTQATDDSAYPVTVTGKFGDVTIHSAPKRVVALGWGDAETALALGVQPIGASDWVEFGGEGVGPWAEGMYDNPPEIIGTLEPSYEQIAALAPDLILDTKSSGEKARHDLLSQIAPTIGLPEGSDNYKTSISQQVGLVSAALGKPDRGADILAELDRRFADVAAAHPEFAGKTITVAARSGTGWGAYTADTERVEFAEKLGFVPNPTIDTLEAVGFSAPVSEENLHVLDADLVVVFPIRESAEDVENTPMFRSIPAVQDGRYVVFDSRDVARSYSTNTTLSITYALDSVVPLFAERTK